MSGNYTPVETDNTDNTPGYFGHVSKFIYMGIFIDLCGLVYGGWLMVSDSFADWLFWVFVVYNITQVLVHIQNIIGYVKYIRRSQPVNSEFSRVDAISRVTEIALLEGLIFTWKWLLIVVYMNRFGWGNPYDGQSLALQMINWKAGNAFLMALSLVLSVKHYTTLRIVEFHYKSH
jgi:hypothetical protein